MLVGLARAVQIAEQPGGTVPRVTFPNHRETPSASRNAPAHLFRTVVHTMDHPHAKLPKATGLRFADRSHSTGPPLDSGRRQYGAPAQRPPSVRQGLRNGDASCVPPPGRCQRHLCRERTRQPSPAAAPLTTARLLERQRELHQLRPRHRLPRTTPYASTGHDRPPRCSRWGTALGPRPPAEGPLDMSGSRLIQTYPRDKYILQPRAPGEKIEQRAAVSGIDRNCAC